MKVKILMQSHVCRNQPKLASARKVNKKLAASILSDIEGPQWMTQTAAEFNRLTDLLVKHSSTNPALSANEINLVATFLTTFSSSHPSFM